MKCFTKPFGDSDIEVAVLFFILNVELDFEAIILLLSSSVVLDPLYRCYTKLCDAPKRNIVDKLTS